MHGYIFPVCSVRKNPLPATIEESEMTEVRSLAYTVLGTITVIVANLVVFSEQQSLISRKTTDTSCMNEPPEVVGLEVEKKYDSVMSTVRTVCECATLILLLFIPLMCTMPMKNLKLFPIGIWVTIAPFVWISSIARNKFTSLYPFVFAGSRSDFERGMFLKNPVVKSTGLCRMSIELLNGGVFGSKHDCCDAISEVNTDPVTNVPKFNTVVYLFSKRLKQHTVFS